MNFESFLSDMVATLVGGIILALIFFWSREKLFPMPNVTGQWYFEMLTVHTSYNPYNDMVLRYVAMLWREGHSIEGTVEKIYENSSTGERQFIGDDRTRGKIKGHIEKNYFGRDLVFLHMIEEGHGRESTNFYELIVDTKDSMTGKFNSMVAEQDGLVKWQRQAF